LIGAIETMERLMGLLKVKVVRGVNLAKRDARGSDPYVVIKMGHQVLFSFIFLNFEKVPYKLAHNMSIFAHFIFLLCEISNLLLYTRDPFIGNSTDFIFYTLIQVYMVVKNRTGALFGC
jgi:hypothetical protein